MPILLSSTDPRRLRLIGEPVEPLIAPDDYLDRLAELGVDGDRDKWATLILCRLREDESYRAQYFEALCEQRIPPRA